MPESGRRSSVWPNFSQLNEEKDMTKTLKLTFIAAVAAVALGSPAFAETYLNEMGTGDVHPIVHTGYWNGGGFYREPATSWSRSARRDRGLHAYAMVPDSGWRDSNHPSRTGGGSLGYNQNLLIW
jgi:hypothetical protein